MHRFLRTTLVAIALVAFALPSFAATLTPVVVSRTSNGADLTALSNAAAGGDQCVNDGRTMLRVQNDSGSNAYTVTVAAPRTVDGQTVGSLAITIATSADRLVGPFPTLTFNNGNLLSWTYTGTAPATDLDVACVRLAN